MKNKGHQIIVVVSAIGGETNRLIEMAKNITDTPNKRELDILASTGEQVTAALLGISLKEMGLSIKSYCGWQIPIITSDEFTQSRIKKIDQKKILKDLEKNDVIIVAGFQGVTEDGDITTLGRGGSDTSAVALAVTFNADECQIFTDVNGIYDADPNKVITAKRINTVDGACMLEAASLGAKVLHVRSCELGYRYKKNIRVLSSFAPQDQGTLVMNQQELENYPIISLSTESDQVLINFKFCGNLNHLLDSIYNICDIDMLQIYQDNISFVINSSQETELNKLFKILKVRNLNTTHNLTKISLIGSGFRSNRELNKKVWNLLESSEVFLTSHNEISMSVIVHNLESATVRTQLSKLLINN